MSDDRRWFIAEGLATTGAAGMVLLFGWYATVGDLSNLTMLPAASASALLSLATMAVAAIGAAVGVWLRNHPLAVFGSVLVLLFGAGQGVVLGPPMLLIAMALLISTYLQWRRHREETA